MCDSSNHEDADQYPKFSDLGCHDFFTSSSDHDVDSLVFNLSKPLVYDDLFVDKFETPQTIKEPHPELMVLLGPRYPEVGFTSDQEIVQTCKVPHHSSICTREHSNTHILFPPLELHNPITHSL